VISHHAPLNSGVDHPTKGGGGGGSTIPKCLMEKKGERQLWSSKRRAAPDSQKKKRKENASFIPGEKRGKREVPLSVQQRQIREGGKDKPFCH